LARWQDRSAEVAELTARAMNGDVPLEAVNGQRLELLKPTCEKLRRLGRLYRQNLLPGADRVIMALQEAGRKVFNVSGGPAEAVVDSGTALGVPAEHNLAVGMADDELSGRWWESGKHPRGAARSIGAGGPRGIRGPPERRL
jgi:phosphoserine phosphatase